MPAPQTPDSFRADLTACLHVERFVDEVAAGAPYASFDALRAAAAASAATLTPAEVDEAMASHPRIGERPTGQGTAQSFSTAEQASADASDEGLARAIAEGNAAYEERFGRVFLIRAAGRSRAEILAELRRRIVLDDPEELAIVSDQLAQIALLRLEQLYGDAAAPIGVAA
ncbi:OHCU decarboxylase [Agromyces rhizosphaerae]|uniref:2-oxo-4-hydroxy-4-carboxy-5-ureidoimidazoline decarboxylase n=1 Tax=Agromyces rhizosphaerae TaxID=88374 RepID=A0A9W6FQ44_9MICO|nr:2-oxo-4-hydroxy-4-carboxy-5-ureidoimidazoline decarboxylase [Agromyces rhizosphaerae]GLI28140.1 OHCU decarboxylase [Agromyces rhizosphaerae]